MLSSLVGEQEVFENKGNLFEDKAPDSDESSNLFGMFDNKPQSDETQEGVSEVKEEVSEEKDDLPEIIEY